MSNIKRFHLGDLLSITTGRLLSRKRTSSRYALLRHLRGGSPVHSAQMAELLEACRPLLLAQFPRLQDVDVRGVKDANYETWLQEQEQRLGTWFHVAAVPHAVPVPSAVSPQRKPAPEPCARPALARMKTGRHLEFVRGQ